MFKNLCYGFGWLLRPECKTLDDHIFYNKRACFKHEQLMDEKYPVSSWECCRGCKWGRMLQYEEDRQERRLTFLSKLLKKRGLPEDIKLSKNIDDGLWHGLWP